MGREKRSPLRRMWRIIVQASNIYIEIDGEQRAAAFAYYVLFSLFPLFALLLIVGSSFFGSGDIISTIKSFLQIDDFQQRFIWEAVHQLEMSRGGVGALSVLILLWCSLRFFQGLVHGVNRAWHTIEIPWWQVPLKNLLMIAIIGSALFAGLIAPAILQGVRNGLLAAEVFLQKHFPNFDLHLVSGLLDLGRYAIGAILLFYSFCMLYKFAPRRRVLFRQVWLPALIVTIALMICQVTFVNYLPHFVNYGIYGAVGGMMLLLLWVYFSGIIIILGACLCAAIEQLREEEEDGIIPASREY
jgi:membrane protein